AVGRPHRPELARAVGRDGVVMAGAVDQPDLRFVDVTVAVAPPLSGADAARGDGRARAVGRRRGEEFIDVTFACDLHRRAAARCDAIDVVHAGDVAAGRVE